MKNADDEIIDLEEFNHGHNNHGKIVSKPKENRHKNISIIGSQSQKQTEIPLSSANEAKVNNDGNSSFNDSKMSETSLKDKKGISNQNINKRNDSVNQNDLHNSFFNGNNQNIDQKNNSFNNSDLDSTKNSISNLNNQNLDKRNGSINRNDLDNTNDSILNKNKQSIDRKNDSVNQNNLDNTKNSISDTNNQNTDNEKENINQNDLDNTKNSIPDTNNQNIDKEKDNINKTNLSNRGINSQNQSTNSRNPNFNNTNQADSNRIQQALNKRNGLNNFAFNQNQDNFNQEQNKQENASKTNKKEVSTKSKTTNESTIQAIASIFLGNNKFLKYYIIASIIVVGFLFVIIIALIGGTSTNDDLGSSTNGYVTGSMTEEQLLEQLEYYGYCKDAESCKKKGAYKFFEKLKSVYELISLPCNGNMEVNKPCGVTINTALIIETINYYENATDNFDTYDVEESSFLETLKNFFKDKIELDTMLKDVDDLAIAQTEYVKESCQYLSQYEKDQDWLDHDADNAYNEHANYYFQISFDKYISYLKYGNSSNHPNYKGKPVEVTNEFCQGAINDYIGTEFDASNSNNLTIDDTTNNYTVEGAGKGVEIANYALQFVGNPYVWGGTDLINGVDCSGFTMKVMEHFGIQIPHSSSEQLNYGTNIGTNIDAALPGDLIVYYGHVAIYLGNNSIVHASNPKSGIKISTNASYRSIAGIVRLWS